MKITDFAYMTSVKEIAFMPALTMMEAAMLPARMPRRMGALRYVRCAQAQRWPAENLGQVNMPLGAELDTDADLGVGAAQNVAPVARGGHQCGLRFFYGRIPGNVFPGGGIRITEMGQHIADVAVCGGYVGKVTAGEHVLRLDAGD